MDFTSRLKKLQQAMHEANLDGLVYGLGANYQYFTGSALRWTREDEPVEPQQLLVISSTSEPRVLCVASATEEAEGALPSALSVTPTESVGELVNLLRDMLKGKRFGTSRYAHTYLTQLIKEAVSGAECVEAEYLGEEIRVVKDADELARLREAAALTDKVMEQIVAILKPGITQNELQQRIVEAGYRLGAEDFSFPPAGLYVKSNTEPTDNPFTYPQDEGLVPGTSIAFDFGFVLNGYCSDFGRSFYCGPAPEHIESAYRALQAAQCHCISEMKPGMRIGDMTSLVLAKLDEFGFGDQFRARVPDGTLGHQIGVDLHENPWLKPHVDTVLRPGMVMCIEPKVWLRGEYYLRVEDMVLVTEDGAESLTTFDRNLFSLPL